MKNHYKGSSFRETSRWHHAVQCEERPDVIFHVEDFRVELRIQEKFIEFHSFRVESIRWFSRHTTTNEKSYRTGLGSSKRVYTLVGERTTVPIERHQSQSSLFRN